MTRRDFLKTSGAGLAGVALLAPQASAFANAAWGPAHRTIELDRDWLFDATATANAALPGFDDAGFARVTLPHSNVRMSWHDIRPADFRGEYAGDRAPYELVSIYRRHFTLPRDALGQRVFVEFDGSMAASTVTINGARLGEYKGGYTPFSFELTPHVDWAGDNVLAVEVDARRIRADIPPFGGQFGDNPDLVQVDFDTFGGLHRSARLKLVPPTFVENVFAKPVDVLSAGRRLDVRCDLSSAAQGGEPVTVEAELRDGERLVARASTQARASDGTVELSLVGLGAVELWDVDRPRLYEVRVRLREGRGQSGRPVHEYRTRVGLREARFTPDGFFLNGRRLQLVGLNRHQTFPYVGNAMPARVQRRDAEILRNELNCNMVRTSHYPQSPDFLDACDELGLLVWDEMPGWSYVGDQAWQDVAAENAEAMIRRDWNHPSVILWAVRVNEAKPDVNAAFEHRLNDLAHRLDPSRQTTGATNNGSRPLPQDVRGFNWYGIEQEHVGDGGRVRDPAFVPMLISEAVGQSNLIPGQGFNRLFRRIDDPAIQQEQAFRHARVHHLVASNQRYAGLLGWCAFEYLSPHRSFEGVKNPGVCDLFRIPKPGAAFYRSQVDPRRRLELEPAFYWDFGDRSPAGPGEEAMICSNCDRLELFLDGEHLASAQPDRARFGNLAYPPFFVDLTIQDGAQRLPELRIDGFLGDRKVISRSFSPDTAHDRLDVQADDPEIAGDGIDATRVVFRAVDRYGAPRPFVTGDVTIEVRGPGELIGDDAFAFEAAGGAGAVWVRSRAAAVGGVVVTVTHPTLGSSGVRVDVTNAPAIASGVG